MKTAKEVLAALCIICWGILCREIPTEEVKRRSVDSRLLGEFLRQYCTLRRKSKVILYGDLNAGWWSAELSERWPYLGRYLTRNDISVSIIDISSHGQQNQQSIAKPPGGFATLMTVLFDGSSTTIGAMLKRSSDLRFFRSRYNWLILTPVSKQNDLEELFQQIGIYTDSNVRFGVMYASQVVKLWEVYHVALDKPLRMTYFGHWSPINSNESLTFGTSIAPNVQNQNLSTKLWKLTVEPLPYKYIKRSNLEGICLRSITVGIRQYLTDFHRNSNGVLEVTGGLFGEVFNTIRETINFTYSLKYIPGYSYGKIKELGNNWTGVVGYLASKRADIALCGISESKWRSTVIDVTTPLLFQRSRLFINSSPSHYQSYLYFRPFTKQLWVVLIIWFSLIELSQRTLRIIYGKLKLKEQKCSHPATNLEKKRKAKNNGNPKFENYMHLTLGRDSSSEDTNASIRLIILSGSILFTVASTGYSSKLTSINAIQQFIPEIKSIDDLSKSPEWEMGILNGNWDRWLMQNSPKNSSMGMLWAEKIQEKPSNVFKHPKEGLLKVSRNQRFAYLGDSLECRLMLAGIKVGTIEDDLEKKQGEMFKLHSYTEEEEMLPHNVACKIAELPGDVLKIGSSFGLQKYSPIKDIFNYHLIKLWTTGVLQNLRRQFIEPPGKLCDTTSVFQPASLGDTFFSLILFGIGVLFSLFVLMIEFITFNIKKRTSYKKQGKKSKNRFHTRNKRHKRNLLKSLNWMNTYARIKKWDLIYQKR